MKKIFGTSIFAFILALSINNTTSAFAATESTSSSEDNENVINYTPATEEQKRIEQIVIQADIQARKEAYAELKPVYGKFSAELLEDTKIYQDIEDTKLFQDTVQSKIDRKIKKFGITRIEDETDPQMGILASPPTTEITINKPSIYTSSQGYFIMASAHWKKDSWGTKYWYHHRPSFGSSVGGEDGLGIYFSNTTNLEISTSSFYTLDNFDRSYNTNLNPSVSRPEGVYYKSQDVYSSLLEQPYYTWDRSYISVWPTFKGKVDTVARTHWTHTWSSAKITSVGVSNSGFSIGISSVSNAYDGVSTQGTSVTYK